MPGDPHASPGHCGGGKEFAYTTCPVAGASGTCFTPVVLKPWESVREMTLVRTRIGAFPGSAWISTSRSENGAALAISVTDALGTNTAAADSPTSSIMSAVM